MRKVFWPFILTVFVLMAGCSIEIDQVSQAETLDASIPNAIFVDFTHKIVEKGVIRFLVQSSLAKQYEEKRLITLEQVVFKEFDSSGNLMNEGECGEAKVFTDSENVELSGNIRLYSGSEKSTVTTRFLFWDGQEKMLKGRDDLLVTVKKETGSELKGAGFTADARNRSYSFSAGVDGVYVKEEEEK